VHELSSATSWTNWFDEIEETLGISPEEAMRRSSEAALPQCTLLLTLLNVMAAPTISPEDLFRAHAHWLTQGHDAPWLKNLGNLSSQLCERAWLRAIKQPSLLRAPRLSIPAIQAACAIEPAGWPKAAHILMAASRAVTVRMAAQMEAVVVGMITESS
jgi:hypothetical protein